MGTSRHSDALSKNVANRFTSPFLQGCGTRWLFCFLRDPAAWLTRVTEGVSPEAAPPEVLDAATARSEAMFLGLRTRRGVDADAFADEFGGPPRAFFATEIEGLRAQALLSEDNGGDLRLTATGLRLSNEVFAHFVADRSGA